VFLRQRHITAVIKRFLDRFAYFGLIRQLGHPPFDAVSLPAGRNFNLVGVSLEGTRPGRILSVKMGRDAHARVSSICVLLAAICTSGLKRCTSLPASLSISNASASA